MNAHNDLNTQSLLSYAREASRQAAYYTNIHEFGTDEFMIVEDQAERSASYWLKQSWLCLITLLESYSPGRLLEEVATAYEKSLKDPVKMDSPEPDIQFPYWPQELDSYIRFLEVAFGQNQESVSLDIIRLIGVLKNTENFLANPTSSWRPCNEDDVDKRVESVLESIYVDLDPNPHISLPLKNFEPDTAIPSLRVYIEYKYAKSKREMKTIVDQILTDSVAYAANRDYFLIFYIYETNRFSKETNWNLLMTKLSLATHCRVLLIKGSEPRQDDRDLKAAFEATLKEK